MDLGLPGGWHVHIFQPWGWIALAVIVLLACALLAKYLLYGITHW